MKQRPLFLFIVVFGFCLGVALVKLAGPVLEYAAARHLKARGFDEASFDLSYPRVGVLVLDNIHLKNDRMQLRAQRAVLSNPLYFLWEGEPPVLEVEAGELTLRHAPPLRLSESAFLALSEFAEDFVFSQLRLKDFSVLLPEGRVWLADLQLDSSSAFLHGQGQLIDAHKSTLRGGMELARGYAAGYFWWELSQSRGEKISWGGLAFEDGKLSSFLSETPDGRTLVREDGFSQARAQLEALAKQTYELAKP